jgi:glutamine amidotransferase-like uncharacterized protein
MPRIAIYRTEEGGAKLFQQQLESLTHSYNVDVQLVTANDILEDALDKETIGLVVPGRSRGQYYRDELGEKGFQRIQSATRNGMGVLAVCAGSYILSREAVWDNSLNSADRKKASCPFPLFDGATIGPMARFWQDGYQASGSSQNDQATILSANIVNVRFDGVEGETHAIYWGGGNFEPSASQTTRILASHNDETPAVIEFECGKGQVIFSNIHPEITSLAFRDVFQHTAKALRNRTGFARDQHRLAAAEDRRQMIFHQFLHNCGLKVPKTLLFPALTPAY